MAVAAMPTTPCSGKSVGGKGDAPIGALAAAIDRDLGGLEAFKTNFNRSGTGVFGSGWVFVTVTKEGRLALASRPKSLSGRFMVDCIVFAA